MHSTISALSRAWPSQVLFGCSTNGSGLDAVEAKQRHEHYTHCVDVLMKHADSGSGMTVHQACLRWANESKDARSAAKRIVASDR